MSHMYFFFSPRLNFFLRKYSLDTKKVSFLYSSNFVLPHDGFEGDSTAFFFFFAILEFTKHGFELWLCNLLSVSLGKLLCLSEPHFLHL